MSKIFLFSWMFDWMFDWMSGLSQTGQVVAATISFGWLLGLVVLVKKYQKGH